MQKIKQSNDRETVRGEGYFSYGVLVMASTDNQAAVQRSGVEDTPGAKGLMIGFEERKEAKIVETS